MARVDESPSAIAPTPQVGARRLAKLVAKDSPGGSLELPVSFGVARPQPAGQLAANDFVHGQAVTAALEYLQARFPKESEWVEKLSYIYLVKGDSGRAMSVLEPLITGGARGAYGGP